MAAVDELSQLKRLILGQEQESLERLQERVERTGTRAQDVAEVLAESFELQQGDSERLSSAMRAPVQRCISDTVREDPKEFADALFPIIGPAIRKAVSESIAALNEKINRALERSFSLQGIKWRIESARTGVAVSQIILRETFIYRVEEAFVIQRDSGLLISHVSRDDISVQDSDAVSAMLTAIQDFVRDSFSSDEGSELDTIRVGEQVVWIFQGPEFTTAAVISGQPPREMRNVFQEVTESIHREYGDAIKTFNGSESDADPLSEKVQLLLQPLLESEIQKPRSATGSAKRLNPLVVISLILAFILVTWMLFRFVENQRLETLADKIAATPGVELLSITPGNPTVLRGMRDPLAVELPTLLEDTAFTTDSIQFDFIPFQSLESPIVVKRVASLFATPESTGMAVENGVLRLSGEAPASYINRLRGFPLTVLGIKDIDTSRLNPSRGDILAKLAAELEIPESVTLRFLEGTVIAEGRADYQWLSVAREYQTSIPSVNKIDLKKVEVEPLSIESYLMSSTNAPELVELKLKARQLFVEGGGPFAWQQALLSAAQKTGFIDSVDSSGFVPIEVEETHALASHISDQKFYFSSSDRLTQDSVALTERLKPDLQRLMALEKSLPLRLKFSVRGFADAAGSPEQHEAVRVKRVARMAKYLIDTGISQGQIALVSGQLEPAEDESLQWRRAEIAVEVQSVEP